MNPLHESILTKSTKLFVSESLLCFSTITLQASLKKHVKNLFLYRTSFS